MGIDYDDIETTNVPQTYFNSLIRGAIADLKEGRITYIFTEEQLEAIKEKMDVKVVERDDFCIQIKAVNKK